MATPATTPRSSRGWLPYMVQSNGYGPSAQRIGSEIDRIIFHEIRTLLRKNPDISTIFSYLWELVEGDLEDEYGILLLLLTMKVAFVSNGIGGGGICD